MSPEDHSRGLRARAVGGPSSARSSCQLLSAYSPFSTPLLPDGKNQLLLALLKCTGEDLEAATICGWHTCRCAQERPSCQGMLMTAAQGRPFCQLGLTFPWSSGPAQGGSNTSENYLDLARFLLCPGDKSQGPGARSLVSCHLPGLG